MKRTFTWIHFVLSVIVVVGVFVQAYLITAYATGAGQDALDAHGAVGGIVIHLSEALIFLTSLVAFWRAWGMVGWSAFLLVLGTVQVFLAPPDEDPASGWVHGFHGLLALFVLVTAAYIAYRDWRLLRLTQPAVAA